MPEPAAPPRSLMLFPADDHRFRDATFLAVELFDPGVRGSDRSASPPQVDDERLLAAAQALLRAAYPLAVILAEPGPPVDVTMRRTTAWMVFRDPAALDHRLPRAARAGQPEAAAQFAARYQAIAFLFAWVASGETAAAKAAVTDAMAQLLGSTEPVDGDHVADRFLRLARRSALSRRTSPAPHDEAPRAHVRLSALLSRLPIDQATAVSLAYREGLSEAEVALAVSLDEVRTRASIREGLARLVDAPFRT